MRPSIGTCISDTACNQHSNQTMTPRKHITNYKNMQKWMFEFLKKFENRGIKIDRVNSILITKSINVLYFCMALEYVNCDKGRFLDHSPFIERSMIKYVICLFKIARSAVFIYSPSFTSWLKYSVWTVQTWTLGLNNIILLYLLIKFFYL